MKLNIAFLKTYLLLVILTVFLVFIFEVRKNLLENTILNHEAMLFSSSINDTTIPESHSSLKVIYVYAKNTLKNENIELELNSSCECRRNERILLTKNTQTENYTVYLKNVKENKLTKLYSLNKFEFFQLNLTCDFYNALRRGPGQKTIGLALYGQTRNYYYYNRLINITRQIKNLYANQWLLRVYYDKTINKSIICQIECMKNEEGEYLNVADFCNINEMYLNYENLQSKKAFNAQYVHAMMWRWFPIGDSFVSAFSSRDSDSYVLQREVDSVDLWIKSDKAGHIMRDHKDHGAFMLGGMWGFKINSNTGTSAQDRKLANEIFKLMIDEKITAPFNSGGGNPKGQDQSFLHQHVYGKLRHISVIHDSHLCLMYKDSTPWPSKRQGNCYVGLVEDCNINIKFDFICNPQCRPKHHQDWDTC